MVSGRYILMLVLLLAIPGCRGRSPADVTVIDRTRSYHTDECPRVMMALTRTMTREEARALRYAACPGCNPDLVR